MKTICLIGVVLVGLSIVTAAQAQTGEELVAQLTGKAKEPTVNTGSWTEAYQKAVDYLLPLMSAENVTSRYAYQIQLQDMGSYAARPGAEAQRLALAEVMVKILQRQAEMDNTVRNWFILQLERIGKAESVPLLAKLMSDEDVNTRDYARRALEMNPDPSATDALLKELADAQDADWKIGLMNALGNRRASSAVKLLTQALGNPDSRIARTAVAALSNIGGQDSAQALSAQLTKPVGPISADAAQGLLHMASEKAAAKDAVGAAKLYGSVYEWARNDKDVPIGVHVAAAMGLIVTDPDRGVKEVLTLIQDENPKMRQAAIQAARMSTAKSAAQALTGMLPKLKSDSQVQVLGLIADLKDISAEAAVIKVLTSGDDTVAPAAASALSQLGTETSANALFDAAVNGGGNVCKAAQVGLAVMPSPKADAVIKTKAASGEAKARAVAIDLLGQRRPEGTAKLLLTYASDADETVRTAAFQAMLNMADTIDIAALTDLVVKITKDGDHAAGVTTLKAVLAKAQDKQAAGKIVMDQMNTAQGPTKLALLSSLSSVGGATALKAVRESVESSEETVRDTAIRTLSEWPDYEAVPALVDIASNPQTPLNHYVLAVRGALRLIAIQRQPMAQPMGRRMGPMVDNAQVESRAEQCLKILDNARRIEEKRQAITTLGTLPCERSVNRLLELTKDDSIKTEAALASVNLASRLLRTNRQAGQELAKKILDMNLSADINKQADAVVNDRGMRGFQRPQ